MEALRSSPIPSELALDAATHAAVIDATAAMARAAQAASLLPNPALQGRARRGAGHPSDRATGQRIPYQSRVLRARRVGWRSQFSSRVRGVSVSPPARRPCACDASNALAMCVGKLCMRPRWRTAVENLLKCCGRYDGPAGRAAAPDAWRTALSRKAGGTGFHDWFHRPLCRLSQSSPSTDTTSTPPSSR